MTDFDSEFESRVAVHLQTLEELRMGNGHVQHEQSPDTEPSTSMACIIEVVERTFERYKDCFDEQTHSSLKVALEIAAVDGAAAVAGLNSEVAT